MCHIDPPWKVPLTIDHYIVPRIVSESIIDRTGTHTRIDAKNSKSAIIDRTGTQMRIDAKNSKSAIMIEQLKIG